MDATSRNNDILNNNKNAYLNSTTRAAKTENDSHFNDSMKDAIIDVEKHRLFLSVRALVCLFMFLSTNTAYSQRSNLGVAINAMINSTAVADDDGMNVTTRCVPAHNKSSNTPEGEFVWNRDQQGTILSAFYWGYIFTQVVTGMASERFGAKIVLVLCLLVSTVCTFITPTAAYWGWGAVVAVRVLMGIAQGGVFPSVQTSMGRWSPPFERSSMIGVSFMGADFGSATCMFITGLFATYVSWQWSFYFYGIQGLIWAVAFWFLVADTPGKHKLISQHERQYIEMSIQATTHHNERESDYDLKTHDEITPWRDIILSIPVWSFVLTEVCASFGYYLINTVLPSYFAQALSFDIESTGFLSALPSIALLLTAPIFTKLCDYVREKKWLSTTDTRKLANSIGLWGQAACLIGAGYCTCGTRELAVALIVISNIFVGLQYSGFVCAPSDLAPHYAGSLYGLSNTFSTLSGIVAPLAASALTPNNTIDEWRHVYWVSGAVLFAGGVIFVVTGSGDLQPWAFGHVKQVYVVEDNKELMRQSVKEEKNTN